jgi:hypothetical protein
LKNKGNIMAPLTSETLESLHLSLSSSSASTSVDYRRNRQGPASKAQLSSDVIELQVDNDSRVQAGQQLTGTIRLQMNAPTSLVKLTFEGIENVVVALPQRRDNHMGAEYLRKHTSEINILVKEEVLLKDCSNKTQRFRFILPDDIPGTIRCILDGTHPKLPSQCHVFYKVTATIFKNSSEAHVSKPIVVLPAPTNVPIDSKISVSIKNPMESLINTVFQCGTLMNVATEDDDDESPSSNNSSCFYFSLASKPSNNLNLSGGQSVNVEVDDWLGRQLKGIWMIQLIEEVSWSARGRTTSTQQSYNLFANHHEVPISIQQSFQSVISSLCVKHKVIIYLTFNEEDPSDEIVASTDPIPVTIVSNTRGCWDA